MIESMYIVEYSEDQQGFKLNNGKWQENTHGWRTIAKNVPDSIANRFCDYMEAKYNKLPKTDVVIAEYKSYTT